MGLDLGDGRPNGDGEYSKTIDGEGTVYIVAGSAGSVGSNPAGYPAMFTSAQALGSVYLEVSGLIMDVKFIDDNGNVDDYFTITKGGSAPTVNITNPTDNEFFPFPEEITISANANDDGSVTQVEFFVDNVSQGIDNSAPYSVLWDIPGSGNYEIEAVATDNESNTKSKTITIQVGNGTSCVKIDNDNDDVEEDDSGGMDLTSSDLEMIQESTDQIIGLRFQNINIPQGATIDLANIQFTCDETSNLNPCVLEIYAENIDDAPAFSNSNANVSTRTKTNASVNWSPPDWNTPGESGVDQLTVDIAPVIQEVVNLPTFSESSSIVIIIEGSGKRVAESFKGSSTGAPEICIEYSLGAPLPIELLEFTANTWDKEVVLNWKTVSEINNDFFSLERSADGVNFQNLIDIPGNGTTSTTSNYHFVDRKPSNGMNYYRLKQYDFDGEFSYSDIVSATISTEEVKYKLYPSLAQDILVLDQNSKTGQHIIISVNDLSGRTLKSFEIQPSIQKTELSLVDLPAGTYFISIFDGVSVDNFKIIKM